MRISELSHVSGVPVATIKYYIREGLLPAGQPVTRTLADYREQHVHRLRLIRALIEVGELSVAATSEIMRKLDEPGAVMHDVLGAAHHALAGPARRDDSQDADEFTTAQRVVDDLVAARHWAVSSTAPARRRLARAIATLREFGLASDSNSLAPYAAAAETLAAHEVNTVPAGPRDVAAWHVVLGTVLYEPVLTALRLLAQEAASARRFGAAEGT